MDFIRWILFGCSTIGFWEILRRRASFHPSFLPVIAVACQSCFLLLAGLLNMLSEAACFLWVFGLAGFVGYTVPGKGKNLNYYLRMEYLFLVTGLVILFFCLRGKLFTHYDNFSHWALVVKTMLLTNRFPSFATPIITYRGYPLGSSVFVYYTAKLIGESESVQMMGQGYMLLACMLPLFRDNHRNRWLVFILMLFAGNFFLAYNVQPTVLLVDTLLPLAGMSALVFACSCKKTDRRENFYIILFLTWVLQIKNSGVFFAVIAGGAYLIPAKRNRRLRSGLACVTAAFFSLFLWNRHCKYVFGAAEASQHFLSASWWRIALQSKTVEDIKHIALEIMRKTFQWEYFGFWLLLLAAAVVYCFFFSKISKLLLGKTAVFAIILYLAYQAGLFLTYVFSMPRDQAFSLVSFDRYEKTIILAIIYLIVFLIIRALSEGRRGDHRIVFTAFASAILCIFLWLHGDVHNALDYQPYRIGEYDCLEARTWMERLKKDYEIPDLPGDGTFYAFLIEGWDSDFFYYLGTYVFSGTDISVLEDANTESLAKITAQYVLIHDRENPEIQKWIQDYYPDQAGNDLIRRW